MDQWITLLTYALICLGFTMLMGWLVLPERWTPDGKREEASMGVGLMIVAMGLVIGFTF